MGSIIKFLESLTAAAWTSFVNLLQSIAKFAESSPTPAWTLFGVLLGVLIGGFVGLGIETFKARKIRKATAEIVFHRLYALLADTNNLFCGGYRVLLGKWDKEDYPMIIYDYLFARSTLPAYKLTMNLAQILFSQQRDLAWISHTLGKLEVAEALRQRCVASANDRRLLLPAWYQYCLALSEFGNGCTHNLMVLYDLSHSRWSRIFKRKKRQTTRESLHMMEGRIEKSWPEFIKTFSKKQRLQAQRGEAHRAAAQAHPSPSAI